MAIEILDFGVVLEKVLITLSKKYLFILPTNYY